MLDVLSKSRVCILATAAAVTFVIACADDRSPASVDAGGDALPAQDAADSPTADVKDAGLSCNLPGAYGSAECMSCVADHCCAPITACESDATCKTLQACVLGCLPRPDAGGCREDCYAATPEGRALWTPIDTCWFGTPPAGCLVECTN